MNLLDLFVKIGVDDQASNKVSSISERLGNGLKKAVKIGVAAISTLSTGFVTLGKIGLDYNKEIETYTTNFEVMMGNAEAAAKKVEELKKMGARTPFELGDLAGATQTLLAFNVSADDSSGVLEKLGDISLGNVQKLESLTRAYGKMNASQKVTLEDINMMIDAGFNPLLIVAEETGKTMTDVYADISAGKVSFDQITAAINTATSEGGQFYQGMQKASQTTEGLISTLKDNVQAKIGELFAGASEKISAFLPKAIEFIDNLDTQKIVDGFERFIGTLERLLPVITGVTAATVAYKAAVSIAGIIDALRTATEGQTIAQALLNAVMNANPFVLVATLVVGLVTAVITLWHTNDDFREALIKAWEAIKTTAEKVWTAIAKFFTEDIPNAFNAVIDFVKNNWQSLLLFITNPIAGALKMLYDLNPKFKAWVDDLIGRIKSWIGGMTDIGKNIVAGIKSGISKAWANLKSWFRGLFGDLIGVAKKILGIASPSKVFKRLGSFTTEGLQLGLEQGAGAVFRTVEGIADGVTASFNPRLSADFGVRTYSGAGVASSSAGGVSAQNTVTRVIVGIDENANAMGFARALLPLLRIAEKEAYA